MMPPVSRSMAAHRSGDTEQKKENRTGLPHGLKAGMENLTAYAAYNTRGAGQRMFPTHAAPTQTDGPVQRVPQQKAWAATLTHKPANQKVVQRVCFEEFDSYREAKNYNKYSKALLDKQKDVRIKSMFGATFGATEKENIYKVNKEFYKKDNITSDGKDRRPLYKQDMKLTPHVDHIFPKSKGGHNGAENARVIPGDTNMSKGAKLVGVNKSPLDTLPPYASLPNTKPFEEDKVKAFGNFSTEQRKAILDANTKYYGLGAPVNDADGMTKLLPTDTSQVPHVDHITAKSEGGTGFYFNAAVLPANENLSKSGKKGLDMELDFEVGEMTLPQFYRYKKKKGENFQTSMQSLNDVSDESEENDDSSENLKKRRFDKDGGDGPEKEKKIKK